jgi:hypothetical protein
VGQATQSVFDQVHAEAQQSSGGNIFDQIHAQSDGTKSDQAKPDSLWREAYDRSSLGSLQKLAGQVSDWAKQKADEKDAANLSTVAKGGQGNAIEAYSPRAGYDLLARTSGLVSSFLAPKNVAITGGVIAANTNPFTGIPVDAALVAHGGYGVYKAGQDISEHGVTPENAQAGLLGGAEMAGGAAGTAMQVKAVPKIFRGSPAETGNVAGAETTPQGGKAPAQSGVVGNIAKQLGITDGPPADLMTRAVKPLASNPGWDAAIAKALPDMKAAEADLGHPITSVDDALQATAIAKKAIWKQYAAKLQSAATGVGGEETGAMIDGNQVADAMLQSIDKRTALQDPGLVERIQKVADTYRRMMPVEESEEFLQSANNDLHGFYAKNKVGRQVAENDPATGHVVAEADSLRDALYSKLDELTGPGAADLKGRYGAQSNIAAELLRRKNVAARQQPQSLAEQLSMARAYGKIAVGIARLSPSSLLEGTESLAAAKWLKARSTSDAMISRAFAALGDSTAPAAAPQAGAGAGIAAATVGRANPDSGKGGYADVLGLLP